MLHALHYAACRVHVYNPYTVYIAIHSPSVPFPAALDVWPRDSRLDWSARYTPPRGPGRRSPHTAHRVTRLGISYSLQLCVHISLLGSVGYTFHEIENRDGPDLTIHGSNTALRYPYSYPTPAQMCATARTCTCSVKVFTKGST